jgi:dihydrolipoamide dehydrogenase
MDVAKMVGRKDAVVKQNNDGILYLFKKNKVSFFHGRGSFVKAADGGYEIKVAGRHRRDADRQAVIVATGSNARALPGVPFDEVNVLSNDGALRIGAVPKKLGLIGSGVIGLEMGSVWRRLGAEVTVLEGLPTFLGAVDEQIAKEAKKAFDKQGLKIELGVKVGEIKVGKKGVSVAYTNAKGEGPDAGGGQAHRLDRPRAQHHRPECRGRGPEAGRARRHRGRRRLQDQPARRLGGGRRGARPDAGAQGRGRGRGRGRAHRRPARARQLQHHSLGDLHQPRDRLGGPTEQQLKADGVKYKAGTFPFLANGRARALGDTTGMVKFLADAATDEILGVHIVGPWPAS